MLLKLQDVFQRACGLNSTRILIVGVSGGPDSLCLLDLLHRSGYPLVVAHLDHKLRPESTKDASYVRGLTAKMEVPCVIATEDVRAYAQSHSLSIEEAARVVRYQFLFGEASRRDAQAVVVGHTADDQIETVLMHWLRGAGLEGLRGMSYIQLPNAWSDTIPLVRPLLDIHKQEILDYCKEHDLQPLMDISNLDRSYFRNRLRHDLIPYLQSFNSGFVDIVLHMADIFREDDAILQDLTSLSWKACVARQGPGYIALKREVFLSQPVSLQRRLLRKAISMQRPGLRDITFQLIQSAIDFFHHPPATGRFDLSAGLRLCNERELTWLAANEAILPLDDWPQISDIICLEPGAAVYRISDDWQLTVEEDQDVETALPKAQANPDPFQAWMDAGCLKFPFEVRPRRPGDQFQPLGMQEGSIKISDYMVNVKLLRRLRAGWPLICSGDEIIWLPGYTINHACRLTADTRRVLHLRLERRQDNR